MDGSYSPADLVIMPVPQATSFMSRLIDFVKQNGNATFLTVATSLLDCREDISLHENFFLTIGRFPYPEIVLNYKDKTIDFINALAEVSIEAVVFFSRNVVNAFSHSFSNLATLTYYIPKLFPILEKTKDELNCHEIWDDEWETTKMALGVNEMPMWKTDIAFSNSIRGSYLGEIDKMMDKSIYLCNYMVVDNYVSKNPGVSIDDLFNDGIHHSKRDEPSGGNPKVRHTKQKTPVVRTGPKKRIDLEPKGGTKMTFSLINSAFKKYQKKTDDVKEI